MEISSYSMTVFLAVVLSALSGQLVGTPTIIIVFRTLMKVKKNLNNSDVVSRKGKIVIGSGS